MSNTPHWSGTDPQALLKSTYAATWPWLQQYIQANSGNTTDAQDIIQESLLAAWINLRAGRFTGNQDQFNAYLRQICKHKWLNQLRSAAHTKTNYREDLSDIGQAEDTQQLLAEQAQEATLLRSSLAKLGDKCRQVLGLFYYKKQTMAQIATITSNTEESVKTIKYRCMQQLRKLYLEQHKAHGGV